MRNKWTISILEIWAIFQTYILKDIKANWSYIYNETYELIIYINLNNTVVYSIQPPNK